MKVLIIIPSRFGSTRYPGKPLINIGGKTLVQRTYLQAQATSLQAKVVVATDNNQIYQHVQNFGTAVMTSELHQSGTDRCFEAAELLGESFDVLINLQGDEPFILPTQIEQLANEFVQTKTQIATLKKQITLTDDIFNPNIVKVVCNSNNEALYFSRNPIPYNRNTEKENWGKQFEYYRHIGIYAFSSTIISQLKTLQTSSLEITESLEQLRWLEAGIPIKVVKTDFMSPAIDTPSDLLLAEEFLRQNPQFG